MRKYLVWFYLLAIFFSSNLLADDTKSKEFSLTTTAFLDKGALPVLYTCDGENKSPELEWSNPPAKTQTFAIVVSDPDAPSGTFYHWVLFNIPKSTAKLDEGAQTFPAGTIAGKNSFGKLTYNGPCPPKGSVHTYIITLYALDNKLALKEGADAKAVLNAAKGHEVGKAELTMVYSRWIK